MMLDAVLLVVVAGLVVVLAAYFVFETWFLAWERRLPSPLARALYRVGADPLRLAPPRAINSIGSRQNSEPWTCLSVSPTQCPICSLHDRGASQR
jgi:hypothetical protein